MNKPTKVNEVIITGHHQMAGDTFAHVPTSDLEAWRGLPEVIEHRGRVYQKAGWSPEKRRTLYRHGIGHKKRWPA